ncbi:Uncharacterised protein [Mycobacteroides abscessus subsp. abscessus]|nr:Uncharacterised protein [Mycobacteroides abscessus subsp. abscessus]
MAAAQARVTVSTSGSVSTRCSVASLCPASARARPASQTARAAAAMVPANRSPCGWSASLSRNGPYQRARPSSPQTAKVPLVQSAAAASEMWGTNPM